MRYAISSTLGLFVALASIACGGANDCADTRTCSEGNVSAGGSSSTGGTTPADGVAGTSESTGGTAPSGGCVDASDCDDGVACNGSEICTSDHHCAAGEPVDCGTDPHCTSTCSEAPGGGYQCVTSANDADGDGHSDVACAADPGDDCDDQDPSSYPGAPEVCDGADNDCDGLGDLADGLTLSGGVKTIPTLSSAAAYEPSIAWIPALKRYGLAWTDDREGQPRIFFARLLGDGSLETMPIKVSAGTSGAAKRPQVVADGSEVVVFWEDSRSAGEQIYAQRIDSFGQPAGTNLPLTSQYASTARFPSAARFGSGWAVSYTFKSAGGIVTRVRTFDDEFQLLSDASLGAAQGGFSAASSLAATGDRLTAVWDVIPTGTSQPSMVALSQGTAPLVSTQMLNAVTSSRPRVATVGDHFAIAYRDGSTPSPSIRYEERAADGSVLCTAPEIASLASDVGPQAIATFSGGSFVAFATYNDGTSFGAVRLVRLADCQVQDELEISTAELDPAAQSVAVAQGDTSYAVVWARGKGSNRLLQVRAFGLNFCD